MIWVLMWSLIGAVYANGQSTHLWISKTAIEQLPSGELKTLLNQYEQQWRNGTMFPDGGYAVEDSYGEISHWEPFQMAYLMWIRENYSIPWNNEAKEHIAFLMGLGSHGLADQSFDAMYFRRSYVYDAQSDWNNSLDTATDVVFVSKTQIQPTVEEWVPTETLLEIFNEQGHVVQEDVVLTGQSRLNLAVFWVGSASTQPDLVEEYTQQFPWTTKNLLDRSIPGNPYMESEIIQEYWQVLWGKLHAQGSNRLLYCDPVSSSFGHPTSKEDIESSISVGLSTAIDTELLNETHISVQFEDGVLHPVLVDIFYGDGSHIINIEPLEDWQSGEYTVLLDAGLPLDDGTVLGSVSNCHFSTLSGAHSDIKRGCTSMPRLIESGLLGVLFILGRRRWTLV